MLASEGSFLFDMPAQSLSKSLQDFSDVTGIEVLVDAQHTVGVGAPVLKGSMAPRSALVVLLKQSNLAADKVAAGAVVLNIVKPPSTPWPGDDHPYLTEVQRAVLAALCKDRLTSPGRYRVALKFWVAPSGDIIRARRLDTTGDDMRDQALDSAISRIKIGKAPPTDFPQPVALVISPGETRGESGCAIGASLRPQ
ncbi:MAG: hypothetical protein CFE29_18010 [Bradyrhizobiaceae bacterium PARB1]|nr:MAG: hypothetical protein CFE29_18010 [Bradyrhizobiaceae bacterium PARB1]